MTHDATTEATATTPPPSLYNSSVDDDLFDDACDLGQFMLNPSWYIFVKIRGGVRDFLQLQTDIQSIAQEAKRSSYLHLQRPLYGVFVVGGWTVVFWNVYPLIRASPLLSDVHISIGYVVAAACGLSWKVASSTSPGEITADTLWKFDHYPYDHLLYRKDAVGPTTRPLLKLARSKYDRFTHRHIPRFDHFCGWLGQPIGEENYREFLIFVAVHALMCIYGSAVTGILILVGRKATGWEVLLQQNSPWTTLLFVFLSVACIPLIGFFGFHIYLIAKGMTTNEYYKWKLISARHAAATDRFHQQQQPRRGRHLQSSLSVVVVVVGGGAAAAASSSEDTDVEGRSTTTLPEQQQQGEDEDEVWTDPGPHPRNQYDNGVVQNFIEVLRPHSLRRGTRGRRPPQESSSKSD